MTVLTVTVLTVTVLTVTVLTVPVLTVTVLTVPGSHTYMLQQIVKGLSVLFTGPVRSVLS
jgi:hypothetical protein